MIVHIFFLMSCVEYPQMPAQTLNTQNFKTQKYKAHAAAASPLKHLHLEKHCVGYEEGAAAHASTPVPVIIPIRPSYFLAQSDPDNFLSILRAHSN